MIKIETHLHSGGTSHCATTEPTAIAQLYAEAGYSAIIVTDHYAQPFFERFADMSHKQQIDRFLQGYHFIKEKGESLGIKVWLGCEVNLDQYNIDYMPSVEYLLYGERVEELLRAKSALNKLSQQELFKCANEYGLLMVQAHPFREYCVRGNPEFMHGVEIHNGNPRHSNNNGLAQEFAREHSLLAISGGDFHRPGDEGRGGVILPECNCVADFVQAIKEKKAELIK